MKQTLFCQSAVIVLLFPVSSRLARVGLGALMLVAMAGCPDASAPIQPDALVALDGSDASSLDASSDGDAAADSVSDATADTVADTLLDGVADMAETFVDSSGLEDGGGDTLDGAAEAEVSPEVVADVPVDVLADGAVDVPPDTGPPTFLNSYPIAAEFPESGYYDAVDHAFYVGSLQDGSVSRVDAATGVETVLFAPTTPGSWWTLGMAVDETERLLWVCAMDDRSDFGDEDQPYDGYIWVLDLVTGERVANHDLSDAFDTAACTDVALADNGKAYVCDREHPNIYEVDLTAGATLFATDPELNGAVVGQNALVVLPDQSALLVAVYLPSKLVRVDLDTAAVQEVDIDGSFFDATFLSGADGMTLSEGSAYVVFSSELVRVTPTLGDWSTATAEEVTVPKGMTDVVSTPNGLYLLNGQAIAYGLGNSPDPFVLNLFLGEL